MAGFEAPGNRILFPSVAGFRPVLLNKVTAQLILARLEANILEQSIRMREGQDASIDVVWVVDELEAKIGQLSRDFSSVFRGLGFDYESVRAPANNGDVASMAEFPGGIEPWRILRAGEERHRGSIRSPRLKG